MRIFLLSIAVLIVTQSFAQIVDDSTKQVYGPKTTMYTTEQNLLNNIDTYQTADTSIYLFERRSIVAKSGWKLQDLGSYGTALFPVFHTPRSFIGRSSGFNAYTRYAITPSEVKYYDTKSPYIDLGVRLGGGNRNLVDVGFSRNVNENWNLGFDLNTITTTKQLAPESQTDRQIVGTSFVGYTHYKHGKVPYQIAFNYSSMKHKVAEIGGARPTTDSLRTDFFLFNNALVRLEDAQGIVKTTRWHAYQDLQIAEQFQLYHVFDHRKEENSYQDFAGAVGVGGYDPYKNFYRQFLINTDTTSDASAFTSLSNEAGLKGDLSSVFYRFYAKVRKIDWDDSLYQRDNIEKYLGGFVRFKWKEKFAVSGNAEYLIGGDYQLKGNLESDLLRVSYTSMKSQVPFVYSSYSGNHHRWQNNFSSVFTNDLDAQLNLLFKSFELKPRVKLTTYKNFLYFDKQVEARQASDEILISSVGGDFNLRILNEKNEGWNLENEVLATKVSGSGGAADFIRIPAIFYNGRFFWRGEWFGDLVPVEVGVSAHGRTAYYANAYAPEIQQFYLQDDTKIFGYVAADLFINMQIDKFFLMLKWTHFNQPQDDGYFVTPNYPGQRKVIDIGVKWMFFD